jgi:hypothetical protein
MFKLLKILTANTVGIFFAPMVNTSAPTARLYTYLQWQSGIYNLGMRTAERHFQPGKRIHQAKRPFA